VTLFESAATLLGAFLAVMFIVNVLAYRHERNGDWHPHLGKMRRMTPKGWDYRSMTPEEARSDADDYAI
jgi:hypothetical protein